MVNFGIEQIKNTVVMIINITVILLMALWFFFCKFDVFFFLFILYLFDDSFSKVPLSTHSIKVF